MVPMAFVACGAVQDEARKSRRLQRLACLYRCTGWVLLIKLARVEPRLIGGRFPASSSDRITWLVLAGPRNFLVGGTN